MVSHSFKQLGRRLLLYLMMSATCAHADEKAANTLTIGAEDDAAPWSYADGSGYVNDLVTQAYRQIGVDIRLHVVPYARCKYEAVNGSLVGCFSTSQTAEAAVDLLFPTTPVISPRFVVLTGASSPVHGCDPKDWSPGASLALVRGYEYVAAIEQLRNRSDYRIELVNSESTTLELLHYNRVDAAVVTLDAIKSLEMLAEQAHLSLPVVKAFIQTCDYGGMPAYLAFSKKHPDARLALEQFENGIRLLEQQGTIEALQQQWAQKSLEIERTSRRANAPRPTGAP